MNKVYIVIEPASCDGYTWRLTWPGIHLSASGYTETYRGAWRAARRRAQKIDNVAWLGKVERLFDGGQ